ncbi:MAG TPA: hypothetical protein PLA90_11460, partial [Candidatus Sumerlaeota bacterium]|nr:hypothetical protein [Candidatus Sumerlaeota bacterium]
MQSPLWSVSRNLDSRNLDSRNTRIPARSDAKAPNAPTLRRPLVLLTLVLGLACALPPGARAQTAVAPTVGDGLTSATAFQLTELGNLVWLGERAAANDTSGTYYTLMNDIDASVTATWNDEETTGTD